MKITGRLLTVLLLLGVAACSEKAATRATIKLPPKPPFAVNVDPALFDKTSATIDNEWWPLKPGTQLTWEGHAFDGDEKVRRKLVLTVTDLTKEVAGVRTLVAWDRDFDNGVLVESELIFLAQDKVGNVWHFGQYAELYDEEGQLDGGTAWLVGYLDGAKAGIMMPANPQLGMEPFSEGFAPPPYYWDDVGRIHKVGVKTCVPTGCYSDVVVIEEFEPTKPGASQLKYYARGIGNVRTGWLGEEEEEREELGLVRSVMLTAAQLADARAEALKLEARGSVYGLTPAIETQAIETPAG